jgi:hypothetical protein
VLTALLAVCVQIGKLRAEAPSGRGCPAAATGSPASSPDLTDISGRQLSIEYDQGGLAAPSHGERDAGKSTVAYPLQKPEGKGSGIHTYNIYYHTYFMLYL